MRRTIEVLAAWLALSVSSLVCLPVPAGATDWPMWRGRNADGVSAETGLPSTWSPEGENLRWKRPIGGRSTPIVVDGRACVITLAEPETPAHWQEQISCFDAETGDLRWEFRYKVFLTDIPHHRVGWASLAADPATGHIYANGIEGMVHCLDRNGKVVWARSLKEEVGRISGYGGRTVTPVLHGNLLFVNFLNAGWGSTAIPRDRFYALDKRTGETVWLTTPGKAPKDTTYTVPVVRRINGQDLLIGGNADGSIYGLSLATGERVWGFPFSKRGINSSVVVDGSRVFASHGEENVDASTAMGRLVCLDAAQVVDGKPKVVWQVDGFTAGYASPALAGNILYHVDNSANLVAFQADTGKQLWKYNLGVMQRASPVVADGKLFVSDVDGQFHVLGLRGHQPPEKLDLERFANADGSAVSINGSPAVANGRIYLLTRNTLYCIGLEDRGPKAPGGAKPQPGEADPFQGPARRVLVEPGEVVLSPGASKTFAARVVDARGRKKPAEATWSLEGIQGRVSSDGQLTLSDGNIPQGGLLIARVGSLKGTARISSRPAIPFQEDFERLEEGTVADGWNSARGRFVVTSLDGNKVLKKLSANPRSWRTMVYLGDWRSSGYEIQAEMMGTEQRRRLPDMGLIAQRYILSLMGNRQKLQIRSWLSELGHFSKTIDYRVDPEVWYRMKLRVELLPEGSGGLIRGKVWKRDEPEPEGWTIEVRDPIVHRQGSPGIYGYSAAEIYYDNVSVAPAGR